MTLISSDSAPSPQPSPPRTGERGPDELWVRERSKSSSCPALALLVVLGLAALPVVGGPVNPQCPVLEGEQVVAGLSLHYDKQEVGFCCIHCRSLFKEDPRPYLSLLPEHVAAVVMAVHFPEPETFDIQDHLDLVSLVVLFLVALLAWRRGTAGGRRVALATVALGLVALAALSWWRAEEVRRQLREAEGELEMARWKELIHNNTYFDFGDPPRPMRPPVEPRLQATFYRGNDERSDQLFNGGNYLTSYFDLAIVDSAGEAIEHGSDVAGQDLALSFQIRRGPNTPDFFWSDELLGDIFLTAESDPFLGYRGPVPDRQGLTTLEALQRWRATYPLGNASGEGEQTIDRVVYVADAWFDGDRMIGATFHYGIVVLLNLVDGKVAGSSEVYLGALFRPRKSPLSRVPHDQWLSHEPLPELPAPQGDDPETLGITDYLDGTS